jgi:Big-like domain-containing protein
MVRQVRLFEHSIVNKMVDEHRVFAFGTHPDATPDDEHPVTTAAARLIDGSSNGMRIIIDELLVGNNLEAILCRATVGPDAYSRVPLGATPDDVKRCAAADDVLDESCQGDHAICVCQLPGGCFRSSDGKTVAMGHPVGIQDTNLDGGADDTRFIAGAVGIKCGAFDLPIDLDHSYWNPSGDQQVPAVGGFDALGPAIVLVPTGPLPTNTNCGLVFSQEVVDKDGNGVCAPPNGDVTFDCTPGDMSALSFKVEALSFTPASWPDGATGISKTEPAFFTPNSTIKDTTLATVKVTEGAATNFTGFTIMQMPTSIRFDWTNLKPLTKYTITFPATITDTFDQPLPAAQTFSFTTGN